jgi:hypothetical protein
MRQAAVLLLVGLMGQPARAADSDVTLSLAHRQSTATPHRAGCTHTGGGNILLSQPSADTIVVTMTGVAVATGHPCADSVAALTFDLLQEFEVTINKKEVGKAQLSLEARVVGLLRSHCKGGGSASISCPAQATVAPCGDGGPGLLHVELPGRAAAGGESLSVNDQFGPVKAEVPAGKFVLHQQFAIQACHPKNWLPCKAASAEFAPDPALDPLWISAKEPFKGAQKKEFGFQVTLKVAPAEVKEERPAGKPEPNPGPKAKP